MLIKSKMSFFNHNQMRSSCFAKLSVKKVKGTVIAMQEARLFCNYLQKVAKSQMCFGFNLRVKTAARRDHERLEMKCNV